MGPSNSIVYTLGYHIDTWTLLVCGLIRMVGFGARDVTYKTGSVVFCRLVEP